MQWPRFVLRPLSVKRPNQIPGRVAGVGAKRSPQERRLGVPADRLQPCVKSTIHLSLAILLVVCSIGCFGSSSNATQTKSTSGKGGEPREIKGGSTQAPPREIVHDWDTPKVAFVFSGEQHGYIEPCGCSENQSGGMSRRADLFQQLRDKGWAVTGLDLGGTLKRSRPQSRIKFQEMVLKPLARMEYAALALGPEELRLGADELLVMGLDADNNPDTLPLLSANTIFHGDPDIGVPVASRLIEINGVTVGVTSVIGKRGQDQIVPEGADPDNFFISFTEIQAAAAQAFQKLQESAEITVLLSHCDKEETKALIAAVPGFDLVMTSGGYEDPDTRKIPTPIGESLMFDVGHKGKKVCVVGYYPDSEQKFRFELVELDKDRFQRTREIEDLMRGYQERLEFEKIAEMMTPVDHISGFKFVGAKACGACHVQAYEKWKSSKHAKAFESIKHGRGGYEGEEGISRIHDPECLSCHVTGWNPQEVFPYESGYFNIEQSAHLQGQQCENCHGPGSKHVEVELLARKENRVVDGLVAQRNFMKLSYKTAEEQICLKCHDHENSPKFDFEKYWEEVRHPWKY